MSRIFIIIEGEKDKSQHKFWKLINYELYNNRLNLIPCNGIRTVGSTYYAWYSQKCIHKDDIVIFDVDCVADNMAVQAYISKLNNMIAGIDPWIDNNNDSKHRAENCYIMSSICFEDTVLSFKPLPNWVYSGTIRESSSIVKEKIALYNKYNTLKYLWYTDESIKKFISKIYKNKAVSTEKVAAKILECITSCSYSDFKVNKGDIGKCYLCNCKDDEGCKCSNINKHRRLTGANSCGLYFKYRREVTTRHNKICALYKNSEMNKQLKICRDYFIKNGYAVANNIIVV